LQRDERFEIPPGQFAFLLTDEILTVPNDVMALINVKSSIKLRGLINVSGFHVDPGYSGRLVISVFNAGPVPIVLSAGDPCFLIWFADLDGDPTYYYKKPGFNKINSDLISRVPSRNTSLLTVSRDLALLKNKTDLVFNIVIGVGVPFFIAVLVALTQIFAQKWYEKSVAVPAELFSGYFLTYVCSALTVILAIFFLKRRLDR
jgi:dCTP deaminase